MRITFLLSARSVIDIIGTAEIEARGHGLLSRGETAKKKERKKRKGKRG